ncbi:MAG TPA: hypothetical protein VMY15_01060 [Candidatus Latescibacteria bacterium]|nr:hypothetical protein [Candidatus Latescibacterota bacterium]
MIKRAVAVVPLLIVLSSIAAENPAGAVSFNGSVKSFFSLYAFSQRSTAWFGLGRPTLASLDNRFRFKLAASPAKALDFDIAYELVPRVQAPALFSLDPFGMGPSPGEYRAADLRPWLYPAHSEPTGSFGLAQNLDRFSITLKFSTADITIGRQVVAWGGARIINPTDVILPFTFNELDKEERSGVDAVRLRIPLGTLSELDTGVVLGRGFSLKDGAAFIRSRFSLAGTDAALLLLGFKRHLLIGVDLARTVGGASLWLEGAYVKAGAFRLEPDPGDRDYFRLSCGADHGLGKNSYVFIEYHFNSAGGRAASDYAGQTATAAYRYGAVYLLGRHYLGAGLTTQLMPLLPVTGLVLWNLGDGSLMAFIQGEYNVAENIYLAAGFQIGGGRGPEVPVDSSPLPGLGIRSEFGLYPDLFFAAARIYF